MAETQIIKYNHVLHYALHYENNHVLQLEYEKILLFYSLLVETLKAAADLYRQRAHEFNTAIVINNLDRVIVGYIDARDLCAFSAVSKHWALICNAEPLWKNCVSQQFGIIPQELNYSPNKKVRDVLKKTQTGKTDEPVVSTTAAVTSSKELYKMQLQRFRQLVWVKTDRTALPTLPQSFLG